MSDGSNYQLDQLLSLGKDCSTFLDYDHIKGGVTFDLDLGQCGMEVTSTKFRKQDFIQFEKKMQIRQTLPGEVTPQIV